ncbi:hypothetical protein [Fontibacillus sp. BL9]|uniref:hypothetical protein n=1 Tax=Fontibacillus sp. BL9 TaxID=3389971 RepID=UPI00397C46F5
MFSDKDYLLLCEMANTGLLNTQHTGGLMEIVRSLRQNLADRKQGDLAQSIFNSAHFVDVELREKRSAGSKLEWFTFINESYNSSVIVVAELSESAENHTYQVNIDHIAQTLLDTLPAGVICSFTGLGQGGWRAAQLAEMLDAEAIVFGAPSMDPLPGKAVNYVGEDDPVGNHTEKVAFVKQVADLDEEDEDFFYKKLEFDTHGKAIVTEQSDFSRFVGWFYNVAGEVEPDIWELFFPGSKDEAEASVLADLGVYSVFLKVGELSKEGIVRSINDTVRYAARRLETNRNEMTAELAKISDEDFESRVTETAEDYAMKASDIVVRIFESVQTLFLGVALFTLEQESNDMVTPMDSFKVQIFDLLDQELERVKECLDQAIACRMESFFKLPDFNLEW